MKKVPGKYFWLLMTITGALMFGAPALVSASEGTASTDTEIGIISKKQWKVADFYKRKLDQMTTR